MKESLTLPLSSIKSKNIDWLWYPYIPFGKITVLQGDPGDGKTSVALFLASYLSNAKKADNIRNICKSKINVIYQSAEDDLEDTIKPRLVKCGADCGSVYFIRNSSDISAENGTLEKAIKEVNARLLILDPIQAYLGKAKITNMSDLRPVFSKLAGIAKRTKCAILIIGHMNKSEGSKALYRGFGSIDIVAVARSILLLCKPNDSTPFRILYQIKNNMTATGLPVCFEFKKEKLTYVGEITDKNEVGANKISTACCFLLKNLENGERKTLDIFEEAKQYSISERTLKRAKEKIGISSIKKQDGWYWSTLRGKSNG